MNEFIDLPELEGNVQVEHTLSLGKNEMVFILSAFIIMLVVYTTFKKVAG